MHQLLATRLDPDYGAVEGSATQLRLDDEVLQAAVRRWGVWQSEALGQLGLASSTDPWEGCPACAETYRAALHDGTPVPKHRMSVMADGCSKCYHYANAGRMQLGDVATSTSFFGEVARKVQDDFADGTVTSAAQQKYAQHCATVAGDDDSSYSCSSNLSCSRASASARGVVDIAGTAGVSCAHGQPGRGLFVAMPTPEQHT